MDTILNLAILTDSEKLFLWQLQVLEALAISEFAQVKLILIKSDNISKEKKAKYSIFYILHENIDRLFFSNSTEYTKKVDMPGKFNEIQVVKAASDQFNLNTILSKSDSNTRPDLILNFGNSPVSDDLLMISRFGVLNYLISNQTECSNSPSCYWEVINELPEIEVSLHLTRKNMEKSRTIYHTGILPYPNSINKNRSNAYMLASILIPRIIKQISAGGDTYINELVKKSNISTNSNLIDCSEKQYPNSVKAISNLLIIFYSFIKKRLLYHKTGRWSIIFKPNEENEFFPPDQSTLRVISAPKGRFWADPFVVSNDGFHYVFVEEFVYKHEKAHISVIKLNEKCDLISYETIIDKPYHLSYPHVFMHEDSYYLVPETGSNRTIELYKCTSFPNKWVFVKNLMENIHAKDPTIFFYNNKWWLFVSIIESSNTSMSFNELFLFFTDDILTGEWQSHPMNPIVSDHKLSRPAGAIYMHDNKIYRPSQDCSGIYGRAVNINCITKLTETDYEEVLISKTGPAPGNKIKGIHTFNFNESIIFMDAFTFRRRIF